MRQLKYASFSLNTARQSDGDANISCFKQKGSCMGDPAISLDHSCQKL